jgi:hypothetical protein
MRLFILLALLALMGFTVASQETPQQVFDDFTFMQSKAVAALVSFSTTYKPKNERCLPLAAFTNVPLSMFYDSDQQSYLDQRKENKKKSAELAKKIACEEDNAHMWRLLEGYLNAVQVATNGAQKIMQRLQAEEKAVNNSHDEV